MKEKVKIKDEFGWLEANRAVALVPVKNLEIDEVYRVDRKIAIYPKGVLDENSIIGSVFDFDFQAKKENFFDSAIIAFPINPPRVLMIGALMPSIKDELIKRTINEAEEFLNIFRYIYSNIDKVSNLPQRAGHVEGIECGFLLYMCAMQSSTYISGKNYVAYQTIGNSLEINVKHMRAMINMLCKAVYCNDTIVSNVIKHALRLYSDILYLPSATNKFVQAMTLIDYLGNPFEYQKMQTNKAKIAPFSADSHFEYNRICERFKDLTSKKDEGGKEIGLRTNIIHNGKSIESLIFEGYKIDMILREIQLYACNYINSILDYCDKDDWSIVEKAIEKKRDGVLAIPHGYEGKYECDCAVVIDFEFLNKAIEEVYQLYPDYHGNSFSIANFLRLVLMQSDIHRPNYQIPCTFIFENDTRIFNEEDTRKLSEYDGLGFTCEDGEVVIYASIQNGSYFEVLENAIRNVISEKNYFFNDGTKYTNIVLISDYNQIPDEVFVKVNNSCKHIILGRLDNMRTQTYDKCIYFDVTYLIMTVLGIPLEEETTGDFLFKSPRYMDDVSKKD